MATGKSNKWFWIIGGAILLAGGVGAYFLLRKKTDDEEEVEVATDEIQVQEEKDASSSPKTYTAPSELNSTDKIKAFQDWMDKYHTLWINDNGKYKNLSKGTATEPDRHIGGKGYGTYGKNTDIAWKTFGKRYVEYLKKASNKGGDKPKSDVNKDIELIVNKATGNKAEKSYLQSTNKDFVSKWADTIRKGKRNQFIWSNQVYTTNTGDKILEWNPIKTKVYAISEEITAFEEASTSSSNLTYPQSKGDEIGVIGDIKYDPIKKILWAYIPKNKKDVSYNWFSMKYLTKTKPKSSFEGVKFEPMSSMDAFDITM